MKKIFLSLISLVSFFLIQSFTNTVFAQDTSVCAGMGFGETGCIRCGYNPDTLPNPTCQMEDSSAIDGVGCLSGSDIPDASVCDVDVSTDEGINACNAKYVACIPRTVQNGGYYCNIDGVVRSCPVCDYDEDTATQDCPTGAQLYDTQSLCDTSCIIPSDNFDCVASEGVCQNSCTTQQEVVTGGTCEPGRGLDVCCRTRFKDKYLCTTNQQTDGIDTAIGCIPFAEPESIAAFLIKWGIRIAGGIAILIFLAAGFLFITSSGNPEKISSAKDMFVAAITGLLMIIFSVFLLQFIGFNVLQIFQP